MSSRHESGKRSPSGWGGRGEGEAGAEPGKSGPEPGKSTLADGPKPAGPTPGGVQPAGAQPADPTLGALPGGTSGAVQASTGAGGKLKAETARKSPTGSNSRKTVGVGELVYIEPENSVDGTFKSDAGTGTQDGIMYNWEAPDSAAKATITFTPKDGSAPSTVELNVIEPSSVEFQDKQELTYGNVSAAGFKVKVAFLPFSVYFGTLDWQEKDVAPSVVEGWFTKQPADKVKHVKGPGGYLDKNNKAKDTAEWKSNVVVKEKSKLQWDIPQHYKVKGDYTGTISGEKAVPNQPFTQLMTIDADGTTSVSKNGVSVTRSPK